MTSRRPWTLVKEDGDWHIRDADGISLMCDTNYYPWCPCEDDDWRLIVAAVNAYQEPLPQRGDPNG